MGIRFDLSKLPYGKRYLVPVATSTAALLFLLVSAYSCKFVRVTRDGSFSPFFFGIWSVEGGVAAGQGYVENTNECIAWSDTPYYDDGGVRAAKLFSVLATFLATATWIVVLVGTVQAIFTKTLWRLLVLTASCTCAVLNILFFCAFASKVCDLDDELTCRMGAAAYLTLTAAVLWMTTGTFMFAWTAKTVCNNETTTTDSSSQRDLVTVVTTHSTPTVPTGTTSSSSAAATARSSTPPSQYHYRHGGHRVPASIPEKYQEKWFTNAHGNSSSSSRDNNSNNSSSNNKLEDPWQDKDTSPKSTPVDLDEEVGVDDMPPTGMPLISITEDDQGNLMKTTITRTVDSQGRTIIDRTVQIIQDNDKAETASV